jgi:hypothetical protein
MLFFCACCVSLVQVYVISLKFGRLEWECSKRYSEFEALHKQLLTLHSGRTLKAIVFPNKRYSKTMEKRVIEERRVAFQSYLQTLLTMPHVANSALFLSFLGLAREQGEASTCPWHGAATRHAFTRPFALTEAAEL